MGKIAGPAPAAKGSKGLVGNNNVILNDTWVRIIALLNMVAALCIFIPDSTIYIVPIVTFFMFVLAYMLYAVKDTLSSMASLGATGMFVWYVVLIFTNRGIMGNMPETWETVNKVIASVAALHCLFISLGKKFFQFTWISMAGLVGLLTMQHVVVTHFRTNG